ncbi:MAG: hypothetical protein Q8P59_01895 [Dehalococcoidia bacterium]|nr:hypothetical protein [Dehalococcoidia bacterium]
MNALSEAVRSEQPSLDLVGGAFKELMRAGDSTEKATLLVIIADLYADSSCRCEEKEASYGEGSSEAASCYRAVKKGREEMFDLYRQFVEAHHG